MSDSDHSPTEQSSAPESSYSQQQETGLAAESAHAAFEGLEQLIGRLERAAEQMRSGDLSTDAAATLVEECAVLANRAGVELQRLGSVERTAAEGISGGAHTPPPGQDSLL